MVRMAVVGGGTPAPPPQILTPHAEALVSGAITAVLNRRCSCGGGVEHKAAEDQGGGMLEVAAESILADVMDDGVPGDAVSARDRFEPILFSCDVSPLDDDDVEVDEEGGAGGGIFAELHEAITGAVIKSEEGEDDEEDAYLARNQCEMCERVTPLTRHHLFPRSQVKHFEKRGFCPPGRSIDEVAAVCRQCHSAIHAFASERELGERYNTVEILLAAEQLAKHARYLSKQRARSVKDGHNNNLRYAK